MCSISLLLYFFFLVQIREETNTRIEMPAESTDSDTIVIVGRRENVEKARKMIIDIEKQMVRASAQSFITSPSTQNKHNVPISEKKNKI